MWMGKSGRKKQYSFLFYYIFFAVGAGFEPGSADCQQVLRCHLHFKMFPFSFLRRVRAPSSGRCVEVSSEVPHQVRVQDVLLLGRLRRGRTRFPDRRRTHLARSDRTLERKVGKRSLTSALGLILKDGGDKLALIASPFLRIRTRQLLYDARLCRRAVWFWGRLR